MKSKTVRCSGYSLLETIVAVGLFSFVLTMALNIFQSINQSQKSAVASQTIQENLRYVLEVMGKEIRQGVRSDDSCYGSAVYRVYNNNSNALVFKKIKTGKEYCVTYYLDSGRLKIRREEKDSSHNIVSTSDDFITPNDIEIASFNFDVFDNNITAFPEDKFQPRVILRIGAQMRNGQELFKQPILVQTAISSRMYGDEIYDD